MTTRPIRFRVESNRAKSSFWYTIVSGNGNTTMTSKAKYSSYGVAKRQAERQIRALQSAPLVLEYVTAAGQVCQEVVTPEATERVPWEYLPAELTTVPIQSESPEHKCSSHGH